MAAHVSISVIVPCADQSRFLATAVASVALQTHPADEIIVVHPADDGATAAVAGQLADGERRLKVISIPERHPATARNAGLAAAQGNIIGFLDGDDAWARGKLALQVARLAMLPEQAAVGGLTILCDDIDPETLAPIGQRGEPVCSPSFGSLLCRRAVFDRIGPIDTELFYSEDIEFYMRLRDFGVTFLALGAVVQYYRQHPASMMHASTPRKESDFRLAVLKSVRRRRRLGLGPATALVLSDSVERT
ncbi:MAG: glycosyltransferase family 2 protein [Parvibaculaceae bacterium]